MSEEEASKGDSNQMIDAEIMEIEAPPPMELVVRPREFEPLSPVMGLFEAMKRLSEFQTFVRGYLKENEDYGIIPGVKKPSLWKSGADKLCELYGLSDDYVELSKTIDWDKGLFDYELKCILYRGDRPVATGLGSCSSYEGKYRWRTSQRKCPKCQKETIIKGKEEYGGGYLCFGKKGGCGAKFSDTDPAILEQVVGQVQNTDIADVKNTILKMAKKRAKVDAVIAATRSSGLFTQDVEDTGMAPDEARNGNGVRKFAELLERMDWIDNCRTLPELQKVYTEAFKAAKDAGDHDAMKQIVAAKDLRKIALGQ